MNLKAEDPAGIDAMQRLFQNPPDDARIMMRWWWFGPAVTKAEISRELRAMKDAGIGGVELAAVYPLSLDDPGAGIKNFTFLSDEHLDALRHANNEARALGLRVDLTLCSGWPFGGPSVPMEQAAGRLRVERTKLPTSGDRVHIPGLGPGENLQAVLLARTNGDTIAPEGARELPVGADGTVALPADRAGATELLFFVSSRTKQQVKRAAVGAEGNVLDHLNRAAVDAYLTHVGDRLLQAFGDKPPYAVFCDSLEVFQCDWTPDLLAEFQKRRGYDLKPFLPALIADFGPRTGEIRRDWSLTLTELLEDRFVQPTREWAARHGTKFRFQGYGIPPARLSTSRLADLPEGEGAQWRAVSAARWASSASHLSGRPVTSAETWTWLRSPAFRAIPLDMKAEADLQFLSGTNQIIGHGWPYSGPANDYPGWRFYAAGALNDHNPWWIVMPDVARYLQRASYLLRQGQPDNDIALYLPEDDARAGFGGKHEPNLFESLQKRIGKEVTTTLLDAGYNFDLFDDEALRVAGKTESGALFPGPNKYKAVVLPNVERMPLETLRKLTDFAAHGGVVIAVRRLPERIPGLKATDVAQKEFDETVQRLFKNAGAPGQFAADEKGALASRLVALVPPDVAFSTDKSGLGFIHRHAGDAEIYFVVNTDQTRREVKATFHVTGLRSEWWNPLTGEVTAVAGATAEKGGTTLALELEPYESRFVVFTRRSTAPDARTATAPTASAAALDLSTGWQVSFDNGKSATMDRLHSWAEDAATRDYSGRATYEKRFDVPPAWMQKGTRAMLDFGPAKALPEETLRNGTRTWIDAPVAEAAVVFVNGVRVGSVWHPPYAVDVTAALRPGVNQLKVVVGNTAINHLAATPQPDYKALNKRFGERFKPQDMDKLQPLPSGLLGPVRLVSAPAGPVPIIPGTDTKPTPPPR